MKNLANETSKLIKGLKLLLLFGFVASFLPFINLVKENNMKTVIQGLQMLNLPWH